MTEDMRSPILPGKGASDYERYLRTDELLALQKPGVGDTYLQTLVREVHRKPPS